VIASAIGLKDFLMNLQIEGILFVTFSTHLKIFIRTQISEGFIGLMKFFLRLL
jgi:hypothetical protein